MRHKRLNQQQILSIIGRQGHFDINPLAYSSHGTVKTLTVMLRAGTLVREKVKLDFHRYTRTPKKEIA